MTIKVWIELGALGLLVVAVVVLRFCERRSLPKRERCPGCEHQPVWMAGCEECGGRGYISK
jgi:hypothetical protein